MIKKVGQLQYLDEIIDAKAINENFVHISGDANIGDLHLSSNLSVDNIVDVGRNTVNSRHSIAVGQNNVILADYSSTLGYANRVASYCYEITGGNYYDRTINVKLNQDENILLNVGDVISYKLGQVNSSFPNYSTITGINGNTISVDVLPPPEYDKKYEDNGDFILIQNPNLWCDKNLVGNKINGTASYIEGQFNAAIGNSNCSHIEGFKNSTVDKYSHAEGFITQAGHSAHSQGRYTKAVGTASFTQGTHCKAGGEQSIAMGRHAYTTRLDETKLLANEMNVAAGDFIAYVEGTFIKIDTDKVALPTKTSDGFFKWDEIEDKSYAWNGKTVEVNTFNDKWLSKYDIRTNEELLEDYFNGKTTRLMDKDYGVVWVVKMSNSGVLSWKMLLPEAETKDNYSFTWNGYAPTKYPYAYESHGQGTFNINPQGGVNGFYIGNSLLTEAISANIIENIGNTIYEDMHYDAEISVTLPYKLPNGTNMNDMTIARIVKAPQAMNGIYIDWGDGSQTEYPPSQKIAERIQHEYASSGNYVIKVRNTADILRFNYCISSEIPVTYSTKAITGIKYAPRNYSNVNNPFTDDSPNKIAISAIGGFAYMTQISDLDFLEPIINGKDIDHLGKISFNMMSNIKNINVLSCMAPTRPVQIASAFQGCSNLENLDGLSNFSIVPGGYFVTSNHKITNVDNLTIDPSVKSLSYSTFNTCNGLSSIKSFDNLPNLSAIQNGAFRALPELTGFEILSSVTSIHATAFFNVPKLSVTFHDRNEAEIKTIANYPFGLSAGVNVIKWDKNGESGSFVV